MDPGKDEENRPQPSGPPTRKKFVIPLEEDEVPSSGAKPLFKSSRNPTPTATSTHSIPLTYAEYAIAQPPGGAGATVPTGSEPATGESPSQTLKAGTKSSSIIVSPRQRGNPVLKFVRSVPWEFGEVTPDYVLGQSTCALFLRKIPSRLLRSWLRFASWLTAPWSWPGEEAGRYLETYKAYEQKPADLLMEKLEQNFLSRATECLTTVKSVNKTDSQTLLTTFGSLEQLITASREDLALCPGLGPQKARRLFEVLHEPFLKVPR